MSEAAKSLEILAAAATNALTDGMVERLTATAGNGMEVLDRLNDETTKDAVMALIDGLTELHRSGALDTAIQAVSALHAARSALTDGMVERLFAFVEHMASTVATEELATLAHEARGALEDANATTSRMKPCGVMGMVKMLTAPESQKTLAFLLAFGSNLRSRTGDFSDLDDRA